MTYYEEAINWLVVDSPSYPLLFLQIARGSEPEPMACWRVEVEGKAHDYFRTLSLQEQFFLSADTRFLPGQPEPLDSYAYEGGPRYWCELGHQLAAKFVRYRYAVQLIGVYKGVAMPTHALRDGAWYRNLWLPMGPKRGPITFEAMSLGDPPSEVLRSHLPR